MNGLMHQRVTRLAWHSLPAHERDAWGLSPDLPANAPAQLKALPSPATVDEKWGLYGCSLDVMGWRSDAARGYPPWLLPDGSTIPHGGVDPAGDSVWCGDQLWAPDAWRRTPRHLVPRIVDAIAAGDHEQAALSFAPLLHFLEDSAVLGHIVPNRWFYEMFDPDPQDWPMIHPVFDNVEPELTTATPRSLGRSIPEVVMRLGLLGEWLYAQNRCRFVPLVQAALNNDQPRLRDIIQPIYQRVVDDLASLFHTLWRLGRDEPLADAGPVDLLDAPPWLIHPGGRYGPCLPVGANIVDGVHRPLEVHRHGDIARIERGWGLTSFHGARYLIEPGAFAHFEGAVGLSARHLHHQDLGLPVTFFVATAPAWVTQTTMDLRYDPPVRDVYTHDLQPGAELHPFRVDLGDTRTVIFGFRPEVTTVNGEERCPFPHIVLAEPRLS